ncbi:MAG TPA: peptidoglycan-binding protein [Acidimicrobiales bacterium]|nr:peptidoglycan-binding protein [Acidimicrobiales bacterium]
MRDLQQRLRALDLPCTPDPEGVFGAGTAAAVQAFQHHRGLRVDGVCGRQTWSALVEAGYRIGDRFLYLRRPMLRGDDVADVQQRLSALGFDTGRVDGIFGDLTSTALAEFQRNVGLAVDGILGASTLRELLRVMPRHSEAEPELVSSVRDRERLRRTPRTLLGRRIAVGEEGGLDALVGAVGRHLTRSGAQVVPLVHPDGSSQAAAANAAGVEAYLGLRLDPRHERCVAAYYSGYSYESEGGRRLAELVATSVAKALGVPAGWAVGMSLPVLRETRMPAVICEMGPPSTVVDRAQMLADALVEAVGAWVATPVD